MEEQFGGDWETLLSYQRSLFMERIQNAHKPDRLTVIYENDLALPLVGSLVKCFKDAGMNPKYVSKSSVTNNNLSLGYSPYGKQIFDALAEVMAPIPVKYVAPPIGANFDEGYIVVMIGARK